MNKINKVKRSIIKEELVAITGDFILAIILDYFMEHGSEWLSKSSLDLSKETMINMSKQSILRKIKILVDKEYIFVRNNPQYKWDKIKQYRVNFKKIYEDLDKFGYVLNRYHN